MSDTWYRDREEIPPYEDFQGNLWTWDGVCLNPIHGCEEPVWMVDMAMVDMQAHYVMTMDEMLARAFGRIWDHREYP